MSAEPANRVMELPSLGADMDFGTVVEWRVAPGDVVARGDIVAVVETEKSDIDIETWHSGTVAELLAEVGRELPVGAPLLRMTDDNGDEGITPLPQDMAPQDMAPQDMAPQDMAPQDMAPRSLAAEEPTVPPIDSTPKDAGASVPERAAPIKRSSGEVAASVRSKAPTEVVLASPRARLAARERGIDLADVAGSGPHGAVLFGDVERAGVSTATPDAPRRATDRRESMRRSIAQRMATANRDIPHYYLESDVDLYAALAGLEQRNESRPLAERIIPAALFIQATALAAKKHPECVGTWGEEGFEPANRIDVGVAVSLRRGGLLTPTITHADERSLAELMTALKELVTAARSGSLRSSWMVDAGITVTNLGDNGAARMQGVIFPPQVALVGFGRIENRPCAVGDQVLVRPMVSVSFAGDHRATDGLTGSRFLSTLINHLEESEF